MKRADIVSGLVVAAAGLLIMQQAATLTYRDEFGPGPGLLPYWLGWILFALAVIQVALAVRSGGEPSTDSVSNKGRVLVVIGGFIAMVAAIEAIGFIASFGLLSFFLVYVVERRSLPRAAAVAVALVLGFLLVFRVFLPIPLP
jgi:putative tricarboxylic transport membrane protein